MVHRIEQPASAGRRWARRLLIVSLWWAVPGTVFGLTVWKSGLPAALVRTSVLALAATTAFTLFEVWPRALPGWMPRWLLQVAGIAVLSPAAVFLMYLLTTSSGAAPFWDDPDRLGGFLIFSVFGTFISVVASSAVLIGQKDQLAKRHRLELDLKASQLERESLKSRLGFLQAQVAPHFLYNTLANVQALVEEGSPQAAEVLDSLVAYLRQSVPRLNHTYATVADEVALATAYLDVMVMRMPDRLTFNVDVDESAHLLRIPPMTLLCLVENAVRHGIDPSPTGGAIDILVQRRGERCLLRVSDTGLGLNAESSGLGTGLASLRERLALVFEGDARLTVVESIEGGVVATVDVPSNIEAI